MGALFVGFYKGSYTLQEGKEGLIPLLEICPKTLQCRSRKHE